MFFSNSLTGAVYAVLDTTRLEETLFLICEDLVVVVVAVVVHRAPASPPYVMYIHPHSSTPYSAICQSSKALRKPRTALKAGGDAGVTYRMSVWFVN